MRNHFRYVHFLIASCVLNSTPAAYADECLVPKRVSVPAVCGEVINIEGDQLPGAQLTLTNEKDAFSAISDQNGTFAMRPIPKGDYTLRATARDYHEAVQQIRISHAFDKHCTRKLIVKLGLSVCQSGVAIKHGGTVR